MRKRIGVSACLLGDNVRWDGGHKRDAFVVEVLGAAAELVPVCPEVELGLGVPREPIDTVGSRLVAKETGRDLTDAMLRYARERVLELKKLGLSGYVLKSKSPSCGKDRGLFARVLEESWPELPVVEETALADGGSRQRFLERVFGSATA